MLIKSHLIENPADVEKTLGVWFDFSHNLFKRLHSVNLRDPKKVEAALKIANALLEAEPTKEGKDVAKKGIEALKKRFGI